MNHASLDAPATLETFSIPEAALAIGSSELTLRRWIADGKVPAPYLQETTRQIKVYSLGEIETLLRVLSTHHSAYISSTDHALLARIQEQMDAYRAHYI